ncbi:MAG: efflux RND transporter periplasmic adaptor subunit [Leptospirales bacterium]
MRQTVTFFSRMWFLILVAGSFCLPTISVAASPSDPHDLVSLSPEAVRSLGISAHPYSPRHGNRHIRISGVVALIDDRVSYITVRSLGASTQIFGRIGKVYADTGDYVTKYQVLVTVFSPDYIEAQQEYLQAIKLAKISGKDPSSLRFSHKITGAAVMRLRNLGVMKAEIESLRKTRLIQRYLPIRSDIDGYVLQKDAISGQTVYSGSRLFTIGNMDWVRVNGQVYQQDVPGVELGERMQIRIPESRTHLSGHVIYISPTTDPKTRTVLVRGIFENRNLLLRPGMFVSVDLLVPYRGKHLWVPRESVFLENNRTVLFIQKKTGQFQMVPVRAGRSEGGKIPVSDHLPPGVRIVDHNGFWIKAQFEKSKNGSAGDDE